MRLTQAATRRPALLLLIAAVLALVSTAPAVAIDLPGVPAPAAQPAAAAPAAPKDPLGRDTPQGLIAGLLKAAAAQDYKRAAQFLDTQDVPSWQLHNTGPELALMLQQVLDQAGWVEGRWQLSDKPGGNEGDNLPPGVDRIGAVRTTYGTVDLLAQRVEGRGPTPIWLVSANTLARLPELTKTAVTGPLERILPDALADTRFLGAPVGHWLALVVLAGVAFGLAWLVSLGVRWAVDRLFRRAQRERVNTLVAAADGPLRLLLSVALFVIGALVMGVSIVARQRAGTGAEIVAWIAVVWLAWRLMNAAATAGASRAAMRGQFAALSVISLMRRTGKVALIALAVFLSLNSLGVDVTAGLAALGIGGLAIALGAQKTVENFIGSLTLIADQPIRVGDFCKFGDTLGTVEDIGIRSSRIRTLERTLVTVPNSVLASATLENYSRRDRFWFHPTLTLRYETTPDQIRYLLVRLREMLYAHPCVSPEPARVRFVGFGAESLNLEIFAYVTATTVEEFLEVQEDLSLRIMDIVSAGGCAFAFPSRTLYMARDTQPDAETSRNAEARVRAWAEAGELPLPRFRPERIAELQNTITYPPKSAEKNGKA